MLSLRLCRKLLCKLLQRCTTSTNQIRVSDPSNSQLMVDIKSNPIQEEDGDASAALANVAHTLRAVSHLYFLRIFS